MQDLIFGYTWEEIQRAQQGGQLRQILPLEAAMAKDDICSAEDLSLFQEHGKNGLITLGYFGTLDRLKRAGIIKNYNTFEGN